MPHDKKLGIYFDDSEIQEETAILLRFNCPDSDCLVYCKAGWGELKAHVKQEHQSLFWQVLSFVI